MGKVSKRRKKIDRISNLPTCLISHILSFLSTKDAVRTSVLSTQWIHQWTSITHLDFDDGPWGENSDDTTSTQFNFVHFVYRVLLFKVTRLDSFRLKCGRNYSGLIHVHSWLSAALSRHVGEIDLTVPKYGVDIPPPCWSSLKLDCLFSSTTLVVLKLGRLFLVRVPDNISLNSLKILHLDTIAFVDNESLPKLVSSCPCLEELKLHGTCSERMEVNALYISSLVLKRLILSLIFYTDEPDLDDPDPDPGLNSYDLILNTPCLEYLEHIDSNVPHRYHFEMKTLHCLDEARLCLLLDTDKYEEHEDMLVPGKAMADLALAISNVQFLYLSQFTFEALNHPDCVMPNFELPKFPRLIELNIGGITLDAGLSLLVAFLQVSPQLESLSFALEEVTLDCVWNPPIVVPICMQHSLEVIQIFLSGVQLEIDMIKYFLENTLSLKELILRESFRRNADAVINKVLTLPRASKSCEIVRT